MTDGTAGTISGTDATTLREIQECVVGWLQNDRQHVTLRKIQLEYDFLTRREASLVLMDASQEILVEQNNNSNSGGGSDSGGGGGLEMTRVQVVVHNNNNNKEQEGPIPMAGKYVVTSVTSVSVQYIIYMWTGALRAL
jgi:hypothetical protein